MKCDSLEYIKNLSSVYDLSSIEVVDTLKDTLKRVYSCGEIESETINGNLVFYRVYYNRYNELKKEVIKINSKDNNKIKEIFNAGLFRKSLKKTLQKIKSKQKYKKGIISGEIMGRTRNGYSVLTEFGNAFLPFSNALISEKRKKLFRPKRSLYFHIHKVYIERGKIKIILDRTSNLIIKQEVRDILSIPKESLIGVSRKEGIEIVLHTKEKISKEEIKEISRRYKEKVKVEIRQW